MFNTTWPEAEPCPGSVKAGLGGYDAGTSNTKRATCLKIETEPIRQVRTHDHQSFSRSQNDIRQ